MNQKTESAGVAVRLHSLRSFAMLVYTPLVWTLVIASIAFWGTATVRTMGVKIPFWRLAAMPLVLLLLSGVTVCWLTFGDAPVNRGIVVAERLTLRAGDGETFEKVATIETAQGQSVEVLIERGEWIRVRTPASDEGWTQRQTIERIGEGVFGQ